MAERRDETGAAYAGSQLQTQLYVNRRTAQVDDAIREEFPELSDASFDWRSPLAADGYREYWDRSFLERVDLGHHAHDLAEFWPTGGPHWDALAVVNRPSDTHPGVLLVEGKSYVNELFGSGSAAAAASRSRERIESSLAWTQAQLGVPDKSPADWCGRVYQSANRLAHLYWLRNLGVRAWLVHLLFVDDPHGPTTAVEWRRAFEQVNQELGVDNSPVAWAGHVLLPAGTYGELVSSGPA